MKLIEAQQRLLDLKQPVLQISDATACLKIGRVHASKILERLAREGGFVRLMRGKWAVSRKIDPLLLPEYLTTPLPSYISLQTALFYHGMISQIPNVIYAVTLARSRRYSTPLGVISTHHIQPNFFFGFGLVNGIKLATPEKALLDVLYLTPAKSNLFKTLPELEIPANFSVKTAYQLIKKIPSERLKNLVKIRLDNLGFANK